MFDRICGRKSAKMRKTPFGNIFIKLKVVHSGDMAPW